MCQRRKTSSRRGARDGGFGNVDAAEVKIRVDSFLGSLLCVSFRANAPPRAGPVPIAGPVPSESRAFRRLRTSPSRRTSSSPLVNGLSDRGVELSSLAPAEAWKELVLIFEASSRLLDPARGSRRSWGVRSDARRGTPSAFAVRAARADRTRGRKCDARRRVRCARRAQTEIYNRVEGHETRAKRLACGGTTHDRVSKTPRSDSRRLFSTFSDWSHDQKNPRVSHARSKSRPQILDRFNAVAVSADRPPLAGGHCGDARGGSAKSLPGPRAVRGVTSARDRRRVGSNARGRAGGDGRPRASVGEKLLHRCRDGPQGRPSCTRVTP